MRFLREPGRQDAWERAAWRILSHTFGFRARRDAELRTVAIVFGPYRNLSTLLSGGLFLHPNCQVLNHAEDRVLGDPKLNFLASQDDRARRRFCQFALFASKRGRRGDYGGSIVHSHAFDHENLAHAYRQRYGPRPVLKRHIRSLVWKGDLRVSEIVQAEIHSVEEMLRRIPKLRFVAPVRNPLDCAFSNVKTGHARRYGDLLQRSVEDLLQWTLAHHEMVAGLCRQFPDRFCMFFEEDFGRADRWIDLANWLGLPSDERWVKDVARLRVVQSSYSYEPRLREIYRNVVAERFSYYPELRQRFETFLTD